MKKIYAKITRVAVVALMVVALVAGCDSNKDRSLISEHNYNLLLGGAILDEMVAIYNMNVAYTGSNVNMTVPGPLAGTVTITGSATGNKEGLTTVDLTYDMENARYVHVNGNFEALIIITGVVREKGSWNNGTGFKAQTYSGNDVHIEGYVKYEKGSDYDLKVVNDTGSLNISIANKTVTVNFAGHQASWRYN